MRYGYADIVVNRLSPLTNIDPMLGQQSFHPVFELPTFSPHAVSELSGLMTVEDSYIALQSVLIEYSLL